MWRHCHFAHQSLAMSQRQPRNVRMIARGPKLTKLLPVVATVTKLRTGCSPKDYSERGQTGSLQAAATHKADAVPRPRTPLQPYVCLLQTHSHLKSDTQPPQITSHTIPWRHTISFMLFHQILAQCKRRWYGWPNGKDGDMSGPMEKTVIWVA